MNGVPVAISVAVIPLWKCFGWSGGGSVFDEAFGVAVLDYDDRDYQCEVEENEAAKNQDEGISDFCDV